MAGRLYTDAGKWAEAVRKAAQQKKDRPFLNGIRRGLKIARDFAAAEVRSVGIIGQSIKMGMGKGSKGTQGLRKRILGTSARRLSETNFQGALTAKGLAALQETGGRMRPHQIKAKPGKALVFQATGRSFFGFGRKRRGLIVAKKVNHPGARVHKHPFLRRALQHAAPRISQELEKAWQETVRTTVG